VLPYFGANYNYFAADEACMASVQCGETEETDGGDLLTVLEPAAASANAQRAHRQNHGYGGHSDQSLSCEQLARQVAEFECGPLRESSMQARIALKKKLLVKWHPDKQPSAEHVALATQVMQELQNRPEWAD